jgi:hypothetical protein
MAEAKAQCRRDDIVAINNLDLYKGEAWQVP